MTKRILRFLGLKVAEAGAFLGIPFGIGKLAFLWPAYSEWLEIEGAGFWCVWAAGFLGLLLLIAAAMAAFLLIVFVMKNWEWAE